MREEHLMKKLQNGKEDALYQIITQYTSYVSYIIQNICGQAISKEDKEEIISNVFISLWKHRAQINTDEFITLKPYLGSIARNMAKNALRSLPRVSIEELDDHISLHSAQSVEAEIIKQDVKMILMQCIKELTPVEQKCIIAYYYYDKPIFDISKETGLSVSNVKSKIFRGRKKIASSLKEKGINYEDLQNYNA